MSEELDASHHLLGRYQAAIDGESLDALPETQAMNLDEEHPEVVLAAFEPLRGQIDEVMIVRKDRGAQSCRVGELLHVGGSELSLLRGAAGINAASAEALRDADIDILVSVDP